MGIWLIAPLVFLLNIPFGVWRSRVRKFSWQWVLAVHVPVPIIIALRIYSGMGFQAYTFPFMIGAFFLGQFTGGKVGQILAARAGSQ